MQTVVGQYSCLSLAGLLVRPAEDDDALKIQAQARYVKNAKALANLYMASYCRAKSQNWDNVPEEFPTIESQGKSAIDTLKALGFLDKEFDEKKFCNASNDPFKVDKLYTANRHGFLEDELSMKVCFVK